MTNLLTFFISLIIDLLAEITNQKHNHSQLYISRYQELRAEYDQFSLEVEALLDMCETTGRKLEKEIKSVKQREAINAERLVILQSTRKHLPNVGLVAIAHIMLTEVDIALLNLDKTTGELIADAAASIARRWTLSTLAIG